MLGVGDWRIHDVVSSLSWAIAHSDLTGRAFSPQRGWGIATQQPSGLFIEEVNRSVDALQDKSLPYSPAEARSAPPTAPPRVY